MKVQRKNALDVALDRWVEDLADRESRLRASADIALVHMGSTPLKNCGRRDPQGERIPSGRGSSEWAINLPIGAAEDRSLLPSNAS
jgi:hypothetical protein